MSRKWDIERGYRFNEKLGTGSFATVYKTYDKVMKVNVAIKCIDKISISKKDADKIITEIQILKMMKHPNIVEMFDFYWDQKCVYIVLEHCDGGDLCKYIKIKKVMPENVCKKFMIQLLDALKYLRSKNVYHYDLKPQNILLQTGPPLTPKISDFGLSLFCTPESKGQFGPRGSPSYMAPEMLLDDEFDPSLVDLWSLGVILYECLHGNLPLPHKTVEQIVHAVKKKSPIKVNKTLSLECKSILGMLLSYDPNSRITFTQLLKHPFFDLQSLPTEENYRNAIKVERQGVKSDFDRDYHQAFNKYCESLRLLVPFVKDIRPSDRSDLSTVEEEQSEGSRSPKEKSDTDLGSEEEFLRQPEEREEESTASSLTISDQNRSKTIYLTTDQVAALKKMVKSTPKILDGLDVGYSAQMYLFERNYKEALEKYVISLSILVPLLQKERSGLRKDLLKIQVKEFLGQAESIKSLLGVATELRKIGDKDCLSIKESTILPTSIAVEDFCHLQ